MKALLNRLHKVKQIGPDRWVACCPAHEDKRPSLSIKRVDDRLLVHDFGGCEPGDILAAVGLTLSDLFDSPLERIPPTRDTRHQHAAAAALKSLSEDALLVAIAAENIAEGVTLAEKDRESLRQAARRIRDARRVAA